MRTTSVRKRRLSITIKLQSMIRTAYVTQDLAMIVHKATDTCNLNVYARSNSMGRLTNDCVKIVKDCISDARASATVLQFHL